MEARRQEVVRKLKDLEAEIKGDNMTTGCHGETHSPQGSRDTR